MVYGLFCIDGGDITKCPHRTEYAKAYDAGCFGHSGAVFRNYLRQRNFTVLGYTPILRL